MATQKCKSHFFDPSLSHEATETRIHLPAHNTVSEKTSLFLYILTPRDVFRPHAEGYSKLLFREADRLISGAAFSNLGA